MANPHTTLRSATLTMICRLALSLGFFLFLGNTTLAQTTTTFDFTSEAFNEEHGLKEGSNMIPVSVDGISITFRSSSEMNTGFYDKDETSCVTLYFGNTMTVTTQDYPIESIVMTFIEESGFLTMPMQTTWTASSGTYDYATNMWKGSDLSVTFSNITTTQIFGLQKIVVTTSATPIEKQTPALAFEKETYTTVLGGTFTPPTLSGVPSGASVTYSSSDTDVATVDASSGKVTAISAGTTLITATTSATATYESATAQYLLEVKASSDARIGNIYKKVTSQADIRDGGIYLVAQTNEGTQDTYAMSQQESKYRVGAKVTLAGATIDTEVNGTRQPVEVVLEALEGEAQGVYALRLPSGEYLTNPLTTKDYQLGTTTATDLSTLRTAAKWKLSYANGTVSIISRNEKNYKKGLRMSSDGYFNAYLADEKQAVCLYQRVEEVAIKTREGYATLYADKAILLPSGLKATTITGIEANNCPTMSWQYVASDLIPANTGLLIRGTYGTTYTCPLLDKTVDAAADNALYGTTTAETPTADGDSYFYYLTYSKVDGVKTLGFYWLADGGVPVVNTPYRAYLKLPKSDFTAATKGFSLTDDATSAIATPVTLPPSPAPIYTLSGIYMGTDRSRLPAGLYIIGGQKVLIR